MYLRPYAIGALSFCPGVPKLLARKATGARPSAAYCYGVWLKHLVLLWQSGMREVPKTLAELGPGDALGVGLAAMLCGVDRYYALDVVEHTDMEANVGILDELVALLRARAPRPDKGWPDFDRHLDNRGFPGHILTDALLERTLAEDRVEEIRDVLLNGSSAADGISIRYIVPWHHADVIAPESVELIVSHAVLQAVGDVDGTYAALGTWLTPGGWMSHQIDFTSQRTARQWNGHWAYDETTWRLISGRRPPLTNREPHSTHLALAKRYGFEVVLDLCRKGTADGISPDQLARRWRTMSDEDLSCAAAFMQARKRPSLRRE